MNVVCQVSWAGWRQWCLHPVPRRWRNRRPRYWRCHFWHFERNGYQTHFIGDTEPFFNVGFFVCRPLEPRRVSISKPSRISAGTRSRTQHTKRWNLFENKAVLTESDRPKVCRQRGECVRAFGFSALHNALGEPRQGDNEAGTPSCVLPRQ